MNYRSRTTIEADNERFRRTADAKKLLSADAPPESRTPSLVAAAATGWAPPDREEARETLCMVAQLIAGWENTTPADEWGEHDTECQRRLLKLQRSLEPNKSGQ